MRRIQYSLYRQRWNIGVTKYTAAVVAGLEGRRLQQKAIEDLIWMDEQCAGFSADPFIVKRPDFNEEYLIFFEFYPWKTKKGRIDCVSFSKGCFGRSRTILEGAYHLSYPYLFRYEDGFAMIPEHSEAADPSLYQLDDNGTVISKTEMGSHLSLVDGTLIYANGRHWLFATLAGLAENSELHIFYADTVQGPWMMHANNPVKCDKSNARPAGQFISFAGKLYRPAQDCFSHYGSGIIINEIKVLTESEFCEDVVSEIRPGATSRYNYGLHTISSAGDYTVIDGARMESSIHPCLNTFGRYVLPKIRIQTANCEGQHS